MKPPKNAIRILKWFCREDLHEEILGDLEELFNRNLEGEKANRARLLFWFDMLKFLRLSNLRKTSIPFQIINISLFRHSLMLGWRYWKKERSLSLVNLVGLATGLAAFLILYSYVEFEKSFDKAYSKTERLYRISANWVDDGVYVETAESCVPLLPLLSEKIPEIEASCRFINLPGFLFTNPGNKARENKVFFVDSSLFRLFDFELAEGSLKNCLDDPFQIVLTEKIANKYFPSGSAVGKTIEYEDDRSKHTFLVTAVIKDLPANTHFDFEVLASMGSMRKMRPWFNNWWYPPAFSYVLLRPGVSEFAMDQNIMKVLKDHAPEEFMDNKPEFVLQRVSRIHLHSKRKAEWKASGNFAQIQMLEFVGFLVLVIALINFVNLVTAQSIKRTREIGLRRSMGAVRSVMIFQFFAESLISISLAIILGFILVFFINNALLLDILGNPVDLQVLNTAEFIFYMIIGLILSVLITAGYPMFLVFQTHPAEAISTFKVRGMKTGFFRTSLVFVQVFVSSFLILSTLVVLFQGQFLRNYSMGFEQENLVAIRMMDNHDTKNFKTLKNDLENLSFVEGVAVSSTIPGKSGFYGFPVKSPDDPERDDLTMKSLGVDEDFLKVYGLSIKEGRSFDERKGDETGAFLLNRSAVDYLGWDEPVGKDLTLTVHTGKEENREGKVIGIIDRFHFASLYNQIDPLIIYINEHHYYTDFLNIRLAKGNIYEQINALEKAYQKFNPNKPFELIFLEQEMSSFYEKEKNAGKLMGFFAGMAILISGLGIFGLVSFSVGRRIKEIGIRKILGASRIQNIGLFLRASLLILIMGSILSWPLHFILANDWLQNFAYAINLSPHIYLLVLLGECFLLIATIGPMVFRASSANPVKSLREP